MKRFERFGFNLNPRIFFVSALTIAAFVTLAFLYPKTVQGYFGKIQNLITSGFGWYYFLSVGFFLLFSLWLAFSPYARVRLGKNDERPEFTYLGWFAMLFSAGMGIGLLFYSVAEPMIHYANPPLGEGLTPAAARKSMQVTFFHWGLHAWAIYIVMGLSLAYFSYRKGLPLTIRAIFYPILGERVYGIWGDVIDIFSVFGTLFGIATSLGFGVMQVNAGLKHLGLVDYNVTTQLILIAIITLIATASVISGLKAGILWLSKINLWLGLLLLVFVFVLGPTVFILKGFVQNTGDYLQNLVSQTFFNSAYRETDWQKNWTLFYWAWWISWSPFVGMFIARISRGRTVREFILGVLLVPTLLTFVWLAVFGNSALYFSLFKQNDSILTAATSTDTVPTALFLLLEKLPLPEITSIIAVIVITTYFITSSDSGSLVIDIITAGGHENPPIKQRIFWAFTEGLVAAALLLTGGLVALQTASLITALPLSVFLVLSAIGLYRSLSKEKQ